MFSHRVTAPARETTSTTSRVRIWARPGRDTVEFAWDAWRKRWTVAVPAEARGGEANRAILQALAERLGVRAGQVRWAHAGRTPAKEAEVTGLSADEVERRLRAGPPS
jgi:uncharacterized protein YggU (UPF0235/DUF167 family)